MQIAESMRPLSNEVCIELTTSAGGIGRGTRRLRPTCEEEGIQLRRPVGRQYGRATVAKVAFCSGCIRCEAGCRRRLSRAGVRQADHENPARLETAIIERSDQSKRSASAAARPL